MPVHHSPPSTSLAARTEPTGRVSASPGAQAGLPEGVPRSSGRRQYLGMGFRPTGGRCGRPIQCYVATSSAMSGEFYQGVRLDELIARAKGGDRCALERLFHWCQPVLDDWVSRRIAKKQAGIARASDIAQDTRLRAFKSFPQFEGTTERQFLAWLQKVFETTTTQAFRDAGRKKRDKAEETQLDDPDALKVLAPQISPSQATANEEQWRLVFGWIFHLPEEQKQAIWLCHLNEMRVAAAAEQMGKSESAVASLLLRGIRTLRERMSNETDGKSAPRSAAPREQEEAAAALLSYLRRRDAGERVDATAFVLEHPSCAEELSSMLEWIERIQALRPTNLDE